MYYDYIYNFNGGWHIPQIPLLGKPLFKIQSKYKILINSSWYKFQNENVGIN